jgi:hypothetical protein
MICRVDDLKILTEEELVEKALQENLEVLCFAICAFRFQFY